MKNTISVATLMIAAALARVAVFEGGKSEWKKDADGKLTLDDKGNPIWLNSDGQEQTVAGDTITRLNGEAMGHRTRAEAAESKLKLFTDAGIKADPDGVKAASEAIATVGKFKQGELITAGKVDEVKAEVAKSFEGKLAEEKKRGDEYEGRYNGLMVQNAFQGSKFIGDKLTIPADIAQAMFGGRFKLVNGKLVGMDEKGEKELYSPTRAGEVASFDEALGIVVEQYTNKASILKGGNNSGSGNNGAGGNTGGKKRYTRAELDATPLDKRGPMMAEVSEGKAELVD